MEKSKYVSEAWKKDSRRSLKAKNKRETPTQRRQRVENEKRIQEENSINLFDGINIREQNTDYDTKESLNN